MLEMSHRKRGQSRRLVRFVGCWCSVASLFSSSPGHPFSANATTTDTRPESWTSKDLQSRYNGVTLVPLPNKRIVGGNDAPKDRYPYFVSLHDTFNGTHKCAGSLVAPDMAISAAHCKGDIKFATVGKYYLESNNNNGNNVLYKSEVFEVVAMHTHPLYNSGVSFSYDSILLKLDRTSANPYVRINTDPRLPSESISSIGNQGVRNDVEDTNNNSGKDRNNLTVMGIGATMFTKTMSREVPNVLQETTTSFVPNRVCRRSKDPEVNDNYQNLVSEDMLCAFEDSQDACQGT